MKRLHVGLCLVVLIGFVAAVFSPLVVAQQQASSRQVLLQGAQTVEGKTPEYRLGWPSNAVEALFWRAMRFARIVAWMTLACHVLLAFWVLSDATGNRKWLFAVLTLAAGMPAAILYALVRLGDQKKT